MKMTLKAWLIASTFIGASALGVFAHAGATGIVKERMEGMSSMAQSVKIISDMFKAGTYDASTHDTNIIVTGARAMQAHAGEELTSLFPEGSNSTASKAKDAIWADWQAFSALADELSLLSVALEVAAGQPVTEGNNADTGMRTTSLGMGTRVDVSDPAALAQLSAEQIFGLVTKTCSTCHTQFRVEE